MARTAIPYFNFYPSDFMHGVRGMSAQEVGVYTMLLCRIYEQSGPIEYNVIRLSTYCGMREKTFVQVVEKLISLGKITLGNGLISIKILDGWVSKTKREKARPSIPLNIVRNVRSQGHCSYCGKDSGPFEIDHIHPWSKGGSHNRENLTLSCRPCNRKKRDLTLQEWMK